MNIDDPKFTAHILGEDDDLTPAERAEIDALISADAEAAADAEETRALAARLRSELQSEQSAPLTDAQRAAVLAANAVPISFRGSSEFEKASVRPWRPSRVLGSLALAASVVLCASLAWKAEFQKPVRPVENFTFTPQSPAARPPDVEEVAVSHSEPEILALKTEEIAKRPAPAAVPAPAATMFGLASTEREAMLAEAEKLPALGLDPTGGVAPQASPEPASAAPHALMSKSLGTRTASEGEIAQAGRSVFARTPAAPQQAQPRPIDRLADSSLSADIGAQLPTEPISRGMVLENQGRPGAEPAKPAAQPAARMAKADVAWASPVRRFSATPAPSPNTTASARGGDVSGSLAKAGRDYYFETPDAPVQRLARAEGLALDDLGKDESKYRRGFGDEPQPDPAGGETAESYDFIADNAFLPVAQAPLSTFSIDVDTASYAIVRRFLNEQHLPPKGAVRIEELINYFTYDYPQPQGDAPFSATMEVAACPWTPAHRLVRIGLKGREIAKDQRPASNLVFLIDVSGSMEPANKLPLLKQSLGLLIDQLGAEDQVAMVVYAGNSGCVLEPTHSKAKMRAALKKLEAGGSTNGASGIQLAYDIAEKSFIKGGTNRVILATDGDWNVGITNPADLFDMIAKKAKGGVFLTVLGVGMDNLKDSMLVKLADKGNGNYGYLDTLIEAKKLLADQLSGTLVTIAKDVKIQVEFNPAQVAAYRLIGYEKRLLAKEDFNDDTKDAGEIGAGHTVTALYEVVPAGGDVPEAAKIDDLKYQPRGAVKSKQAAEDEIRKLYESGEVANRRVFGEPSSKEMLTLKLRYKAPDGDVSKLLEFPLTDTGSKWENSSRDFRFAAAVAGYGMLLRDSPHKGTATWNSVRELAVEGKGEDATGYRAEFITLLEKARALSR